MGIQFIAVMVGIYQAMTKINRLTYVIKLLNKC